MAVPMSVAVLVAVAVLMSVPVALLVAVLVAVTVAQLSVAHGCQDAARVSGDQLTHVEPDPAWSTFARPFGVTPWTACDQRNYTCSMIISP